MLLFRAALLRGRPAQGGQPRKRLERDEVVELVEFTKLILPGSISEGRVRELVALGRLLEAFPGMYHALRLADTAADSPAWSPRWIRQFASQVHSALVSETLDKVAHLKVAPPPLPPAPATQVPHPEGHEPEVQPAPSSPPASSTLALPAPRPHPPQPAVPRPTAEPKVAPLRPPLQALNGHPQRPLQQQRAPYNKPVAEPFKPRIPTVRTTGPALLTRQPQRGAPMGDVEDEPADPAVTRAATDVRQYCACRLALLGGRVLLLREARARRASTSTACP